MSASMSAPSDGEASQLQKYSLEDMESGKGVRELMLEVLTVDKTSS